MKRLILMRHAKTEPWTEGIDDYGRALTSSGHFASEAMAIALHAAGWLPDQAIVSSARRTRETWKHLSDVFGDCDVRFDESLYLAGERGISEYVAQAERAGTLLMIGHNPGMHDLVVRLIRKAGSADHRAALRASSKMPTGSVALFEAGQDGAFVPTQFRLQNFIRPKDLV